MKGLELVVRHRSTDNGRKVWRRLAHPSNELLRGRPQRRSRRRRDEARLRNWRVAWTYNHLLITNFAGVSALVRGSFHEFMLKLANQPECQRVSFNPVKSHFRRKHVIEVRPHLG